MATYYLVFKVLLNRGTEDYIAFLLIGLVSWQWFANAVSQSAGAINANKNLVCQVSFPKLVLPSITVLVNTIKFLFVLVLLLGLLLALGYSPGTSYFAAPFVLIVEFFLICGCSYLSALIATYVPDFQVLLPNILRLTMFLSGIFYDVRTLSENYQSWFNLNPMWVIINAQRNIFIDNAEPDFHTLGLILLLSLLTILGCKLAMLRFDSKIPGVLLQR